MKDKKELFDGSFKALAEVEPSQLIGQRESSGPEKELTDGRIALAIARFNATGIKTPRFDPTERVSEDQRRFATLCKKMREFDITPNQIADHLMRNICLPRFKDVFGWREVCIFHSGTPVPIQGPPDCS
jgi:hypothetical protein